MTELAWTCVKAGALLLGTEGKLIEPVHAGIVNMAGQDWLNFHFNDGAHGGRPTLAFRKLDWSADGWPVVAPATNSVGAGK